MKMQFQQYIIARKPDVWVTQFLSSGKVIATSSTCGIEVGGMSSRLIWFIGISFPSRYPLVTPPIPIRVNARQVRLSNGMRRSTSFTWAEAEGTAGQ